MYEERDASLCADAQCTVKKNSSTLDWSKPPFVEALFQQKIDRALAEMQQHVDNLQRTISELATGGSYSINRSR
jgi:hypothetical protein